ncbi:unnamed protein product, partial [Effrenium voratum]
MECATEDFAAVLRKVSFVVNGYVSFKVPRWEAFDPMSPALELPPAADMMTFLDSLFVVAVTSGLRQMFPDVAIPPTTLFDSPTIEKLTQAIIDRGPFPLRSVSPPADQQNPQSHPAAASAAFTQLTMFTRPAPVDCARVYSETDFADRFVRNRDGMECVLLPAATAQIGCDATGLARENEQPMHVVRLDSFLVDVEPVSVGAFVRFLNLARPGPTELSDWCLLPPTDKRHGFVPLQAAANGGWEAKMGVPLSWPMILVSWYGANAYGLWAHGRDWANYKSEGFLPTEAQWEYAARGSEFRDFPWGSGAEPGQLNVSWDEMPAPERVQELPLEPVNKLLGLSPFGLRGMAGNIWQWCRDTYDPDFYRSKQA